MENVEVEGGGSGFEPAGAAFMVMNLSDSVEHLRTVDAVGFTMAGVELERQ